MSKKSRAQRFKSAQESVDYALVQFTILQEELQDWLDNMPENLQESAKAEEIDSVIDDLDGVICDAENIVNAEIEFPRMIG